MVKRTQGVFALVTLAVCLGSWRPAYAEAPLDLVLDLESEQAWLTPFWSGQHGPSDSQVRASLERDLQRLRSSETGPEQEEEIEQEQTKKPKRHRKNIFEKWFDDFKDFLDNAE